MCGTENAWRFVSLWLGLEMIDDRGVYLQIIQTVSATPISSKHRALLSTPQLLYYTVCWAICAFQCKEQPGVEPAVRWYVNDLVAPCVHSWIANQ